MNRTSAIALFLLIFISHPTVLTATRVETLKLIFGQLFSIPVGNDVDVETLPNWMEYNGTSVYGIPQLDKVKQNNEYPNTKIRIADDVWLNIEYDFHDPNPCEYDDTLFFEVYKDKAYDDYPIKNLSEIIQDFATIMDVKVPNFRVFRADYLKIWRRENNEVLKQLGEKPIRDDQLVIVWKLGCGSFDDDDDNYNIVTVVSDNQFNFRVIQGVVNDIPPEVRPVTPPSTLTELERTTRQVDNPPMRVLPLGEYQCVKYVVSYFVGEIRAD
uniref:Dystroglycan C-terminal domain-containing protein n=1 Tax=Panagrolaimus sp. JU765 TaxID=591449 RepID=A0AC34QHI2_9BILA